MNLFRTFRPDKPRVGTEILYACDVPANETFRKGFWYKESPGIAFLRPLTLFIDIREVRRVDVDLSHLPVESHRASDGNEFLRIDFRISLVFNDINLEFRVEGPDGVLELASESVPYRKVGKTSYP